MFTPYQNTTHVIGDSSENMELAGRGGNAAGEREGCVCLMEEY